MNFAKVLRASFLQKTSAQLILKMYAEFVVVIHIVYPAVITLNLKEHLEIRGHCSYH